MNLIIDIGNTKAKMAHFEKGELSKKQEFLSEDRIAINEAIENTIGVERAIVSNVSSPFEFPSPKFPVLVLSKDLALPFEMKYATPDTLGKDRLALSAAAKGHFPEKNCLVIDMGTCVTFDLLTANGQYLGGGISPGLEMRLKSLPHFTANLPKVAYRKDFNLVGDSTENSILSGTVGGFKREIEATIEVYKLRYPSLITVITGGDAFLFDYLLKNSIFAAPDFLLKGLNHILEYNAKRL